ncbi:unnamed protein product [Citrullus colocynthis]|uniref:Kinesin motor domain-containing protein n=1 Tax=Citrullus colocynthis TaxID=252529 RepID=A0ABP0YX70_9ROSI
MLRQQWKTQIAPILSQTSFSVLVLVPITGREYFTADLKHTEREFLLKFSAIEIYNESVRDLLSVDNAPLRLLDDPERGTTVEKLIEETLKDWNHFRQVLSICEGKDKSSSLTTTVECASQSLSAGVPLKEGCHINPSLLTLGTVIRKLSKGRNGHISFRDSKLTRILQSSLGGNAITAIICTMSPAQIHVEQSRNPLFFASCAKEVVTNAQLQRELGRLESELKSSVQTSGTPDFTLIREKDLQIEKLKKDLRELTLEPDYAQSQVKDLLRMVEEDKPLISSTDLDDQYPRLQYSGAHHNIRSDDNFMHLVEVEKDFPQEELSCENSEDICKEVRCIEMEESSFYHNLIYGEYQGIPGTPPIWLGKDFVGRPEGFQIKLAALKYDVESERSSLTCSQTSLKSASKEEHSEQNFDVLEDDKSDVTTSATELEHDQISNLERENQRLDAAKQISNLDRENHLLDATVLKAKPKPIESEKNVEDVESEKNVEDVGMDPFHNNNDMISPSKWPSEFRSLQQDIINCGIFVMSRVDPADSIYMEVEFRRLSFLKDTFSRANPTVENGQTLTPGLSLKALRQERQMLCRQVQKRFSKKEREPIYRMGN